jgi:hypothetical protein
VPVPNCFLALAVPLSVSFSLSGSDVLLAYAGFGPGQELIPYFLALLTFVGAALLAVVQWPLAILLRWLSRLRNGGKEEIKNTPIPADVPESPGEGSHHKP